MVCNGDVCDSETGGHGKVGDHSNGQDQGAQPDSQLARIPYSAQASSPMEESSTFLDSLRQDKHPNETEGEKNKDDPERSVSDMGSVDELVMRSGLSYKCGSFSVKGRFVSMKGRGESEHYSRKIPWGEASDQSDEGGEDHWYLLEGSPRWFPLP